MKRMKRFLLLSIIVLLLNGCVKNNVTMRINNDKSMNLEVSILVKEEYKDTLTGSFKPSDLENNGFKVSTTNKDDYSGYKITKSFKNIDELSKSNNETSDISNILESSFDYSKLFTRESGFFKDTYSAKYIFSLDKYQYASNETTDATNEMELKFEVSLPRVPNDNNATEKSSDSKYLSWKISNTATSDIRFSFDIYNMKNIIIVAGSGIGLIVLIVVILIIKKKKRSKAALIYKEYDPSIENKLNKNEIIKEEPVTNQIVEENKIVEVSNANVQNVSIAPTVTPTNVQQPASVQNLQPQPQVAVPQTPSQATVSPAPTNSGVINMANPNNGMQTLSSLEFEIPEDELIKRQQEEKKEDKFEVKPNTFNYNRRPDFVKHEEPNKFILDNTNDLTNELEKTKAKVETIKTPEIITPDYVDVEIKEATVEPPAAKPISAEIDVPNAVALSDMKEIK